MISIDEFVRRHLEPCAASLVDQDVLDFRADFGASSWRTPEASAPLAQRSPDALARDLHTLWCGRSELDGLVDPLVALCRSLGPVRDGVDLASDEIDGGQYPLF